MTRKSAVARWSLPLAAVLGALWAAPALAQTAPLYEGEVTGTRVNVRSGPSTNHYIVCVLGSGTRVRVHEEKFGWLAITPPDGCFSLVHKDFVDLAPDGKSATVKADNVLFRAGSMVNDKKDTPQGKLQRGATVTVLGETAGFLKIVPPPDALVYVSAQYVAKLGADGQPVATPVAAGAVEPTSQPAGAGMEATPAAYAGSQPSTEPTAAPAGAGYAGQQADLADVENRLNLIFKRPVPQQTFDDVEPILQKLADSGDAFTAARARGRLQQIQRVRENQKLLAELATINQAASAVVTKSEEERQRDRERALAELLGQKPGFVATGKLDISNVWADIPGPKRYRLRDPQTGQTTAYVQVSDDTRFDIRRLIGAVVGITGRREFDARNNVYVVYPDEITLLTETSRPAPGGPSAVEPNKSSAAPVIENSGPTSAPATP